MPTTREVRPQPTCAVAGFGRVFYGAADRLYFSQVFLDDISSLGRCYQKNDPTAEVANDILATDGGEILLQESGFIIALARFHLGILAFCTKGVWYISGGESGFTATSYTVNKITSERIVGTRAYTSMGSDLVFGAKDSLFIVQNNEFNVPKVESLTDFSIKSYWQTFASSNLQMQFDEVNKQLVFLRCGCIQGKALIYDARVQAFFPWELKGRSHEGVLYSPRRGVLFLGRDSSSDFVSSDEEVLRDSSGNRLRGAAESLLIIAQTVKSPVYADYGISTYDSYMVTNYESLGNYTRQKGVPLVNVFFRKTEAQVTSDSEGLSFDKPSGCDMSVLWDYDTTNGKYTAPRSIYNPVPRGYIPSTEGTSSFDTGATIVTFKDKVRGKGRAVQFKFESQGNKAMSILGFSVQFSAKGRM